MSHVGICLNEETVERCLANGQKLKETVNDMIEVTVIQWERNNWGESEREFGRELFYLSAIIKPKTDIDDKGYVTQAWFEVPWVQNFQDMDGKKWALMKPSRFVIPDPVVYFETYIDGTKARLIPHPDF